MDYSQLFRLDGKRALVIGAAGGIGAEVAQALAAHGAEVVCSDLDLAGAEQTAGLLESSSPRTLPAVYGLNVTDPAEVSKAVDDLPVEILVATPATNVRKRMVDYDLAEFDRVVNLNLRANFELLRTFGKAMAGRGGGSMIAFSSIRSVTTEPGQGVYAATKAGLVQLVRTAAAEFGASGVRVNAIAPGVVATTLTQQIRSDPAWDRAYAEKSALGRWSRPDELAGAAVFLASDASSFVTGSQLFVDGGWTAIDGRFDPPN